MIRQAVRERQRLINSPFVCVAGGGGIIPPPPVDRRVPVVVPACPDCGGGMVRDRYARVADVVNTTDNATHYSEEAA